MKFSFPTSLLAPKSKKKWETKVTACQKIEAWDKEMLEYLNAIRDCHKPLLLIYVHFLYHLYYYIKY
jgi:hypothetical protein